MNTDTMDMGTEYGFCFRPELGREDCSGRLHLWLDHLGETRFVPTPYDVRHSEWDALSGTLDLTRSSFLRRGRLALYARGMQRDMIRLERIVSSLRLSRARFTASELMEIVVRDNDK